ncbi:MAG: hypothetical protein O2958_04215 [Gemmatimonadetes bacterium]|nr:hypothetical protein [Gemmatimonadota bacterium]MDA1102510.1 hypothetical protein [Gemmatimonadota bacterium]
MRPSTPPPPRPLGTHTALSLDPDRIAASIETLHRRIEERFSDSVVLQAGDEVEALTMGLSRKIWQKIMILDAASGKQ